MGIKIICIFSYIIKTARQGEILWSLIVRVNQKDYDSATFIKIIREWTNLTQKQFGKEIGRSERTIQDYEAGITNYNIKTLEKISKKFNISIIAEKNNNK